MIYILKTHVSICKRVSANLDLVRSRSVSIHFRLAVVRERAVLTVEEGSGGACEGRVRGERRFRRSTVVLPDVLLQLQEK